MNGAEHAPTPLHGRRRARLGGLLMVVGVALIILGSALAWNATALLGFTIGSFGLLAVCVGAIFVRQGMVGHFEMGNGTAEDEP